MVGAIKTLIVVYLPYLLSVITIYTMWLAGSKRKHTWFIGLINQALWLLWILVSNSFGFIPMNIALWIVYIRNHLKWR